MTLNILKTISGVSYFSSSWLSDFRKHWENTLIVKSKSAEIFSNLTLPVLYNSVNLVELLRFVKVTKIIDYFIIIYSLDRKPYKKPT